MKRLLLWLMALVAVTAIAIGVLVTRVPTSPLAGSPDTGRYPAAEAYAQRLGDCVACHSVPNGAAFAGGLKMGTPLGVIYSTNITPDNDTGIGAYSLADFDNAVRRGVARDGHRLYPAMPYPSYAKLTDDDVRRLYGFFMYDVKPVHRANQASEIPFPLNQRWPLALWEAAYTEPGTYQPKPGRDAVWNRGAYLVQSFGHCGACHTARGLLFNERGLDEKSDSYLSGALLDGWYASDLRGDPVAGLGRWTEADIIGFLKAGHNEHGMVFGSMLDAYNNSTQFMSDADLAAIAAYLKSLPGTGGESASSYAAQSPTPAALDKGGLDAPGALVYLNQCSSCHGRDGAGHAELLPALAGTPAALEEDPSSIINILLNGSNRIVANGVPDSYRMPPFRVLLSDQEIADVANFIRSNWGNKAPQVTAAQVAALRASTDSTSDHVIVLKLR